MSDARSLIDDLAWAADYDPQDPRLGLNWEDLSSYRISRREMIRLMIATGATGYLATLLRPQPVLAQGSPGGELKAGWDVREFTNFDPAFVNQVVQFSVYSNVLGGLTHIDAGLIARPDLAESWEVSPDGLTWTFRLRRNVRWHNGDRFNADDVIFTFNRTRDPATGHLARSVIAPVERAEKLDDFTIRFHLSEPRASFLLKITERTSGRVLTIVNRRALQEMGREYTRRPIGTGPFRMTEHRLGERVVLEKFPDYYISGRPMLDRVTIFNIEEPATLASALESGQVEFINNVPEALFARLKGNRDIAFSDADDPGFQSIFFNLRRDKREKIGKDRLPTDDPRVRLAVAKALDRQELIQKALFGQGVPAYGPIPRAQKQYFRDLGAASPQRFDPEDARRLMREAGFADGFSIKMLVTPGVRRRAEVIADILRRHIRVNVELEVVDFPVQVQRFNFTGQWEWCQIGSGGDPDPDDSIDDWFASRSRFNNFGYSNSQVDALNAAIKETPDVSKRVRWVQAAVDLIARDAPAAFLFHNVESVAFRRNVRGFVHIPGLRDLDTVTVR
ncbi:MAG: ABC transporter substrate-binding protein [Armatimonadota bacterium]